MKLKTIKIISILGIFSLSFLTHYIYEFFPNIITSILFPINESLFEHMKLIFITYLIWNIIEYILLKKNNYLYNFKPNLILSILLNIIIFLIIFYPIYLSFEHNLIVTLIIYFISISVTQIISYYILSSNKDFKILKKYFYIIIILLIIISGLFTYYPLNNNFFIDYMNKKIGFSNYY
jgi:hypothetical protein